MSLGWDILFSFLDADGTYSWEKEGELCQYEAWCYPSMGFVRLKYDLNYIKQSVPAGTSVWVPYFTVPSYAALSVDDWLKANPFLKKVVDTCGALCYGDQNFKGIVYAQNNVEVNLGDQFKFLVTGSLRAEKGHIKITCKDTALTYDESALDTLLPSDSQLSRVLWNCW